MNPPASQSTKDREKQSTSSNKKSGGRAGESAGGFLGVIEKVGNKLPNPFWLFVILAGLVAITSWIGSTIVATIGAVILLWIVGVVQSRR